MIGSRKTTKSRLIVDKISELNKIRKASIRKRIKKLEGRKSKKHLTGKTLLQLQKINSQSGNSVKKLAHIIVN